MIRVNRKAALYARFSSENQRTESIDAQVRAMRAYCEQNGIDIVEIYVDEAKSATTDRRPAFQRMIADSGKRVFDIVLVHKLDRFARNRYDSAVYKRELKKNGVTVYSVIENLDDSPESIMLEAILEGMNEYYSENLARETMKGLKETAYQCKHTGGKPPLGYDIDPISKRLVINPIEAECVKVIFNMYARGCGYTEILRVLYQAGYKTKNGNSFMKTSLYSILTNPKYQGIYVYNRCSAKSAAGTRNTHQLKSDADIITIEGGCPQIVDSDIYEKVQQRIDGSKHTGGRNNAKITYLLSGKVYCMECGRAMVGNKRFSGRSKRLYITYRCPSKNYCCSNKEINREYLEQYIIELLEDRILNTTALREISKRIKDSYCDCSEKLADNIAKEQARLSEVVRAIVNITEVIASGLRSNALIAKLSELEAERSEIEASIAKMESGGVAQDSVTVNPQHILQQYAEVRKAPSSPAYKGFIQSFIDRIEVGRYTVRVYLKTGLEIFPTLNTTILVRREEIYKGKSRG